MRFGVVFFFRVTKSLSVAVIQISYFSLRKKYEIISLRQTEIIIFRILANLFRSVCISNVYAIFFCSTSQLRLRCRHWRSEILSKNTQCKIVTRFGTAFPRFASPAYNSIRYEPHSMTAINITRKTSRSHFHFRSKNQDWRIENFKAATLHARTDKKEVSIVRNLHISSTNAARFSHVLFIRLHIYTRFSPAHESHCKNLQR